MNNKITINKEFDLNYNIDFVKINIKKLSSVPLTFFQSS